MASNMQMSMNHNSPMNALQLASLATKLAFVHVAISILSGNSVSVFWQIRAYICTAGRFLYQYGQIRTGRQTCCNPLAKVRVNESGIKCQKVKVPKSTTSMKKKWLKSLCIISSFKVFGHGWWTDNGQTNTTDYIDLYGTHIHLHNWLHRSIWYSHSSTQLTT